MNEVLTGCAVLAGGVAGIFFLVLLIAGIKEAMFILWREFLSAWNYIWGKE